MADLEVSEEVRAPAETVYDLVSDLTRMGEWSPECVGGRWIRGASGPAVGAWFKGSNRHGLRRWTGRVVITAAERGRRFAFETHFGRSTVALWAYRIDPTPDGCVVTEEWSDRRPRWLVLAYPYVIGIRDRAEANRVNMRTTLARLKGVAETLSPMT